ncbi:MAG TPA: phosphoribosylformylglycinamidine synthase subunit PurL, partial [Actinomycetota bacterium]|nr:phosphoribosylformylglycinamidine synthase subunit PurL [Actinomycetota bacterium]
YIEPYQGAATGVGGIVRDILSMGARPLAVMDQLRFGDPADTDTTRVVHGVVAGVGGYGNCLGLPNIGGETVFDPCYQTNPLVNALCVGAMRHEDIHVSSARGTGNLVVLYGALTGGDGIGGVSVLASESFDETGPSKRPAVQVGDPFTEKLLIECTLELLRADLVEGIQDLGGAGLSCATSEMASNGDGGMHVWLDRVPLRDATLSPEEILMSESQERMCAIVTPANRDAFLAICERWAVTATVIGEVTAGDRLVIEWHDEVVVDVPPRTVAHDGPVYHRPLAEPAGLAARQAVPTEPERTDPAETLLALLSSPNNASKAWVTDQYDRYVRGNTVLAQPEDAGVLRIDEQTGRGVAVATDCNARFVELDPYRGTQLALAEAYRNVAATGAVPLAVTNCLNFGSPEDPAVMWQFAQSVTGLADACQELRIPVTGGNVSFYNQTGTTAIHPSPVVGVLGVFDDVARRTPMAWGPDGELIYVLGATRPEFGGSAVATLQGLLSGMPPQVDLTAERVLAEILVAGSRDGMLTAAHDVADGGIGLALAEMAMRAGTGARTWVPDGVDAFTWLFSESAARAVVVVARSEELRFTEMCGARRFGCERIGVVDSGLGEVLQIGDIELAIPQMRELSAGVLPALFA